MKPSEEGRPLNARSFWFAAGALSIVLAPSATIAQDADRGKRLFHGELPLSGKIVGHANALPPEASRCVNCHRPMAAQRTSPAVSGTSGSAFGPVLDAASLTRDNKRRGGPPSRYDEAAFCKLLATGIDPAYILVPSTMPRYELGSADCRALWAYLATN